MQIQTRQLYSVPKTILGIIIGLAAIFAPVSAGMRLLAFIASVIYFFIGVFGY